MLISYFVLMSTTSFSHPEMMLKRIRESLSDSGQIVLAEFRGEDATVPIKPLHKMTKLQVKKELEPNGFNSRT